MDINGLVFIGFIFLSTIKQVLLFNFYSNVKLVSLIWHESVSKWGYSFSVFLIYNISIKHSLYGRFYQQKIHNVKALSFLSEYRCYAKQYKGINWIFCTWLGIRCKIFCITFNKVATIYFLHQNIVFSKFNVRF